MGSHRRKKKASGQLRAQPAPKKGKVVPIVAAFAAMGLIGAVVYLNVSGRPSEAAKGVARSTPATAASTGAAETPAPATTQMAASPTATGKAAVDPAEATVGSKSSYDMLKGKWQRPDGGYIIEVKSVSDSGKMDASYRNPRPINVSKAEASRDGKTVKVFIELRDVNYPGSTYDLIYDPQDDSLKGIYYQAARQQRFEVAFIRIN